MPRRRFRQPVRYAFAEHEGPHRVVDQHHGYALGGHTTRAAAEATARELSSNTTAAIPAIAATAAMEVLDAAQTDPAAAEPRTSSCRARPVTPSPSASAHSLSQA
ncbi:hypothetical protein [Streptomyces sp. NPDC004680]|uniref:hypothetical protein n=1 Tax=Streptomyces sp. NPDC004680 TaxID=3154287 RepID=UPI0033A21886